MFKYKFSLFIFLVAGTNFSNTFDLSKISNKMPDYVKNYCKPVIGACVVSGILYKLYNSYKIAKNQAFIKSNFALAQTQGSHSRMEDFSFVERFDNCMFSAVFDGHGDKDVAQYLAANLHKNLNLKEGLCPKDVQDIIHTTFKNIQEQITKEDFDLWEQGSTALVSIFYNHKIYVANLGDSRAVLSKNGKAFDLSTDHKVKMSFESQRISELGGKIFQDKLSVSKKNYGDCDVAVASIDVSRSFGHLFFQPYLTSVPEIREHILTNSDEFLILATDGLWDVISSQEAVDIVKNEFINDRNCERAAEKLKNIAIEKHSNDNITVIVIDLKN